MITTCFSDLQIISSSESNGRHRHPSLEGLYQRKPMNGEFNSAAALNERLKELEIERKELDKLRSSSAFQRNLVYPLAMVLLLFFTALTVLLVIQNSLELLIGIKALPLSTRVGFLLLFWSGNSLVTKQKSRWGRVIQFELKGMSGRMRGWGGSEGVRLKSWCEDKWVRGSGSQFAIREECQVSNRKRWNWVTWESTSIILYFALTFSSFQQFTLGISSLSKLGLFGAVLEVCLIFYLGATSTVGLYTMPFMKYVKPQKRRTSLSQLILNCALLLILSSALPLLSRIIGITNFDLLGDFGAIEWLGNFQIVLMYNLVFGTTTALCLMNKFTATVRRELCARLYENYFLITNYMSIINWWLLVLLQDDATKLLTFKKRTTLRNFRES